MHAHTRMHTYIHKVGGDKAENAHDLTPPPSVIVMCKAPVEGETRKMVIVYFLAYETC